MGHKVTCKDCFGTGKHQYCDGDGWWGLGYKCKNCRGTGKCPRCMGEGHFWVNPKKKKSSVNIRVG